ncbi:hypothetical protein [Phytomonospora endophytica]|uniref:Uncharacterized protein n=1 Tax=Phytomonospora endophytica TaxID=714109 RepID=A0A841FHY1_9ACTN|nr:hypothetical protein [Phytomonospora endophytica]MBB6035474.1 hypothetical protein [Phytomonospora endophytica]GIG63773.1 hypothetical protein Pen01_00680 [Phytomonospora endophytica]
MNQLDFSRLTALDLDPVTVFLLGAATALLTVVGVAAVRHIARRCGCTLGALVDCVFRQLAALVLRRGRGRHRMWDGYQSQRTIRADFDRLSRWS